MVPEPTLKQWVASYRCLRLVLFLRRLQLPLCFSNSTPICTMPAEDCHGHDSNPDMQGFAVRLAGESE